MKKTIYLPLVLALALSCAKSPAEITDNNELVLSPVFPGRVTRATDADFENGDKVGVYITRYNGEKPSPLQLAGNVGSNLTLTCNGSSWQLTPMVYWDDNKYDIYGYYPQQEINSVDALQFSVAVDQTVIGGVEGMSAFEKSDFLWAKVSGVTRTGTVPLVFKHKMCKVKVDLIKGDDYEGDMPTNAEVFIHNTVTDAYVDLSTGDIVKNNRASSQSIHARKLSVDSFEAIVVPQRLSNRVPLVEVVCGQVSYLFESTAIFKSGTVHQVNITLSDNPERVAIDIGGQIENW